jgi:hypothetical protein
MTKTRRRVATDWANKPRSKTIAPRAVEAIARRRRQMLIHSCLYYKLDSPVIDDHTWTRWAQQLAKLQDKYGYRIGFYDAVFEDWDGSSGFHLPADSDVVRVARRVHDEVRDREMILS